MRRAAVLCLLLGLTTLAAYWPVRQAGFTNFDDDVYVTDNPQVLHGLTREGIAWAFTTFQACNWHPLTWLSHMADCSLFGENAAGAHLVSVGLHVANAWLLLLLLWRMTGALWRSGFVAALFALHPLHVESAAWIAERKDVLSTFFGLLALHAYAGYVSGVRCGVSDGTTPTAPTTRNPKLHSAIRTLPSAFWYALALACFLLALMSKPMLVSLPLVMLLLDYWPLRRPGLTARGAELKALPAVVREKLPFFALAAASAAVTFWAQKNGGAVITMKNIPLASRLANAAVAYATYVAKVFWPTKLAVPYPFVLELPATQVAFAVLCLVGLSVVCLGATKRAPYLLVGWLWFLGTLVPVIGLVQVGVQARADRYTYLPAVGLFIMVSWGVVEWTARWRYQRLALPAGAAAVLTGCFICTRLQVGYWQSNLALFSHTLEVTKDNAVAEQCYGFALAVSGHEREAVGHFDAALRLWPDYLPARLDRGIALMLGGQVEPAIAEFREAIRLQPRSEKAYYQLAGALARQKKLAEAKANYLLALRCQPEFAEAHSKLGKLLLLEGERTNAMAQLNEAVTIRPDCAEAQYALGNELAQLGNYPEAVVHLRAAVDAQPNYASALNDLAWLLATRDEPGIRNVPEAIHLAAHACDLTWNREGRLLATLGVAYSEAGRFPEAIHVTEQALALTTAVGDETTTAGLRRRLEGFRRGQPYHSLSP